jgi:tripartite-type tricarboxylate transporter receptor subunit TctC
MYRTRPITALAALLLAVAAAPVASRADWPDRPIKWVVPFTAGGANDLIARAAAEGVARRLKQPVVIENKPGAGTAVGSEYVAKSKGDGYIFLIGSAGTITNSMIRKDMPYEDKDLVPVGMIAVAPSVIVVNPSVPANNMKEFVSWAASQGANGVTWATAGTASTPHFVAEMLKEAGVTNLVIVPYKSGNEGMTSVMSGNVNGTSEASIVVLEQVKAGKLKAIATTYDTRITSANTILEKMNAELLAVVKSKEFHDKLVPHGIEPAPYSLPAYVAFINAERERLGRIARVAKMKAE